MKSLRKKTYVTGTVKVVRGGVGKSQRKTWSVDSIDCILVWLEKSIPASELVPGDLIYIKPEEPQLLHCDAVIVEGSCSVDESMLTGESYPITKVADKFSMKFIPQI